MLIKCQLFDINVESVQNFESKKQILVNLNVIAKLFGALYRDSLASLFVSIGFATQDKLSKTGLPVND